MTTGRRDLLVVVLLVAAGAVLGSTFTRNARRQLQAPAVPEFTQRVLGAALMSACGRGQTTPPVNAAGATVPTAFQPLNDFLTQRREQFACSELPADVPATGLDGMQRASRYLIVLATVPWMLAGPSWAGIDWLLGVMFGMSAALAYLICRLAMGVGVAGVIALLFLLSPIQLSNLLDLRDYAKAPFFLASLLILGLLMTGRRSARAVVGYAALAGAVLGIGFGVRTDVVITLVLLLAALLVFFPAPLNTSWKLRLIATATCVASFLVVASPIFGSNASGSNLWHWALLGYSQPFDRELGVEPGPYELSYFYSDSYVATTVDAFWGRVRQSKTQVSVGLPQYADASGDYYRLILTTFPADALLRGWAAVIAVLDLPFSGINPLPPGNIPGWLQRIVSVTASLLTPLFGWGVGLFAIAVLATSARSVRIAALLLTVVVFLGAYTAIQFQLRHVFHLELLALWLTGFLVSGAVRLVSPAVAANPEPRRQAAWRQPLAFAVIVLVLVTVPLATVRAYQQGTAASLFTSYHDAAIEAIPLSPSIVRPGLARVTVPALGGSRSDRSMQSEMLVAAISRERCPADRATLTFRYGGANSEVDFTRVYEVAAPATGTTRVFFPLFLTGSASPNPELIAFDGVDIAETELPCLASLGRVLASDQLPLLIPAVLPPDWRDRALHQTLAGWERSDFPRTTPSTHFAPPSLGLSSAGIGARAAVAPAGFGTAPDYVAPIATLGDGETVAADGAAASSGAYLVAWRPRTLAAGQVVVVEGLLSRGGITIGLTGASGWITKVDIDQAGPYRAFIQAGQAGTYQLVVASHLGSSSMRNRVTVSRVAVVDGEP